MSYFDALREAMTVLAADARTVFVGQAVAYPGQRAFTTFEGVPSHRRIEMPVIEDFQLGFSTGLALAGFVPVSFFPRWDFLLLAANQMVNHLDKLPAMGWRPRVIVRVGVGSDKPLDPGPQHTQDHGAAFRLMLSTVEVVDLLEEQQIVPAYRAALERDGPTILVERMALY